ncbi:MAG: hypothetical protein U9R79_20475, partial [Armatimonadota bacterium]|nr:hypothetical protein [Armatimonadota bacterium]
MSHDAMAGESQQVRADEERGEERRPQDLRYLIATRVAIVAGVFCAIVFALMLANLIRARSADPTAPARIEQLKAKANRDGWTPELREQFSTLDQQLRREYFRSRRFAIQGIFMLLGGVVVLLISLQFAAQWADEGPFPDASSVEQPILASAVNRRAVVAMGLLMGGLLAALAVLARHDAVAAYARQAE